MRGYLGLYARYLGLDASQIIGFYDSQYPADPIAIRPAISQALDKKSKRYSKTLSLVVSLVVFSVLVYGYCKLEPIFFSEQDNPENILKETQANGSESNVNAIIEEAEGAKDLANDALNGFPIKGQKSELLSDLSLENIELESMDSINFLSENSNQKLTDEGLSGEKQATEAVIEIPIKDADIAFKSENEISLKISFTKDCWIKITDARGKTLASGVFSSNRPIDIKVVLPIVLITARPHAIKNLLVKNKSVKINSYRVDKRRFEIK